LMLSATNALAINTKHRLQRVKGYGLTRGLTHEKDSEAVLGVWLPATLPKPRALPDHGALWPLAVGVENDLGGIDV